MERNNRKKKGKKNLTATDEDHHLKEDDIGTSWDETRHTVPSLVINHEMISRITQPKGLQGSLHNCPNSRWDRLFATSAEFATARSFSQGHKTTPTANYFIN
ncbi:hypothetical protein FOVG_00404 [Fusarium oxysporum f. sp. pisi HDV247]|uniref:Uncharacterized protein n=1 Tax=Fusarium oxysporum f. sp. pisi HDV247 TaxID=1080344 RepID=W9Q368_FUSOX|nr:hypothetical protein FOVG_00404 [Fusarium oxysporum f. sp. pisi HDV247]